MADGIVQEGGEFFPRFVRLRFRQIGLHVSLLFAVAAPLFAAEETGGGKSGGLVKPSGENGVGVEPSGFSRQNQKDRLGDLFGVCGIFHLPESDRINQADMAVYQSFKGRLGISEAILSQQVHVMYFGHLPIYYRQTPNRTFFFLKPRNPEEVCALQDAQGAAEEKGDFHESLRAQAKGAGVVDVRVFHRAGCPVPRQARCLPLQRKRPPILVNAR
jgi:hypothetical protein